MMHFKTACFVLVTALIFSTVLFFSSSIALIIETKATAQHVLDNFISEKKEEIYANIKNGKNAVNDFTHSYFVNGLKSSLNLTSPDGQYLYRKDKDGKLIYKLLYPNAYLLTSEKLYFKVATSISIPFNFNGEKEIFINVPITLKAELKIKR